MFCSKCGAAVVGNFCAVCGEKVRTPGQDLVITFRRTARSVKGWVYERTHDYANEKLLRLCWEAAETLVGGVKHGSMALTQDNITSQDIDQVAEFTGDLYRMALSLVDCQVGDRFSESLQGQYHRSKQRPQ